jgi:hypothetical protein
MAQGPTNKPAEGRPSRAALKGERNRAAVSKDERSNALERENIASRYREKSRTFARAFHIPPLSA